MSQVIVIGAHEYGSSRSSQGTGLYHFGALTFLPHGFSIALDFFTMTADQLTLTPAQTQARLIL